MKLKKVILAVLLCASQGIRAMDGQEWTCEIFPYMKELLRGAFVSVQFKCNQADMSDKLFASIKEGNSTAVATILQEHPTLLDVAEDSDGVTPLLAATLTGNDALVSQLLARQPQVDRCSHQGFALVSKGGKSDWLPISGFTPLMAAAKYNYENIAKQLLSANASKEMKDFSRPGKRALDYAKEAGHIKMVNLLT